MDMIIVDCAVLQTTLVLFVDCYSHRDVRYARQRSIEYIKASGKNLVLCGLSAQPESKEHNKQFSRPLSKS
jgi:hypothetical protein